MRASATVALAWRGSASSAARSDSSSPLAASTSASEGTSLSRNAEICAGGMAPVNWDTTLPSLECLDVRDPAHAETPAGAAGWRRSPPSQVRPAPSRFATSASMAGPSARHGPHHSAQKSTTTGTSCERSMTFASKSASVTSETTNRDYLASGLRPAIPGKLTGAWKILCAASSWLHLQHSPIRTSPGLSFS